MSSLALWVGSMPWRERINSSSLKVSLSLATALLTAGWDIPRCSAAPESLPCSITAANTVSRFKSTLRKLMAIGHRCIFQSLVW